MRQSWLGVFAFLKNSLPEFPQDAFCARVGDARLPRGFRNSWCFQLQVHAHKVAFAFREPFDCDIDGTPELFSNQPSSRLLCFATAKPFNLSGLIIGPSRSSFAAQSVNTREPERFVHIFLQVGHARGVHRWIDEFMPDGFSGGGSLRNPSRESIQAVCRHYVSPLKLSVILFHLLRYRKDSEVHTRQQRGFVVSALQIGFGLVGVHERKKSENLSLLPTFLQIFSEIMQNGW